MPAWRDSCKHYNLKMIEKDGVHMLAECTACGKRTTDGQIFFVDEGDVEHEQKKLDPIHCEHMRIIGVGRNNDSEVWVECETCGMFSDDGMTWISDMPPDEEDAVIPAAKVMSGLKKYHIVVPTSGLVLDPWLARSEEDALAKYLKKKPYMVRWSPVAVVAEE